MAKNKAIALCRVSTAKQRLEGSSLEAQEVRVYECAQFLDSEIIKLWSLNASSRKGKNVARKDLEEMYAFCKQDKSIKYIIVDEADRFMRSIEEAYFWKVKLELIGVTLAYANMPEITHEDNPMAVMREMMALFQGEISNHERITKTTEKMQAKIRAGYYPGMVHSAYKISSTPSLHVPREPQWSLLKESMHKVVYEGYSMSDALDWLNKNGYRLQGGGLIDMHKLKDIYKQPYYAGIIKMSDWDVVCKKGLHIAMITEEEHEQLVAVVSGKRKKFAVHKYNPLFPASNIIECADCLLEGKKEARVVGYRHHNNKPQRTRKYYERYRCRSCGKNVLKSVLHEGLDALFDKTELILDDKQLFIDSLRKVWRAEVINSIETITRLKQKQTILVKEKDNLIRSMATNPDIASDIKDSVTIIKSEIEGIQSEIERASNIEEDFEQFVDFALEYCEKLRENWWALESAEERIRLKQLVYVDGLRISRQGKVLTPTLSPIYRYKTQKKMPESIIFRSKIATGGPGGT